MAISACDIKVRIRIWHASCAHSHALFARLSRLLCTHMHAFACARICKHFHACDVNARISAHAKRCHTNARNSMLGYANARIKGELMGLSGIISNCIHSPVL